MKDFREVLEDKAVDVLSIAAPNHWHAPATILACAAGKHVYVEKPCCHNPHEGELMVAAARKHKRVVQMGNQRRSCPWVIEAMLKFTPYIQEAMVVCAPGGSTLAAILNIEMRSLTWESERRLQCKNWEKCCRHSGVKCMAGWRAKA